MADLILASLHHLAVFSLAAILAVEIALTRPGMSAAQVIQVSRIDIGFGIAAGVVLVVGFARIFFGSGSADYYFSNIAFLLKLAAFLLVGLLSIPPTLKYIRWRKLAAADPIFTPPLDELRSVRNYMRVEAVVFGSILVFAAAMARGFG